MNKYKNELDIDVGDIVICNSNKTKISNYSGAGWELNHQFQVTRVDKYIDHNVYFGGINGMGVYSDCVTKVFPKLSEFPNEGYCKTDDKRLRVYLKNKFPEYTQKAWNEKYTIVAWNTTSYWWCEEKSNKDRYYLEQLLPFIKFVQEKTMFKKGDYIVCLNTPDTDYFFPKNYIFKQRENEKYLSPKLDARNSKINGWRAIDFKGEECYGKWRYATQQEIEEYDRLGKPYDVTTLSNPQFEVGKWYKIGNWIGKFVKLEGNKFWTEFAITPHDGYVNDKTNGYINIEDTIPILITDLSEIQQYLPDDHPDKIIKSIKKWDINTYIVFIKPIWNNQIGKIDTITKSVNHNHCFELSNHSICDTEREEKGEIKWFATLKEAEEFSKTLLIPKLQWKTGAFVKYKGTKSNVGSWKTWFGSYGVKAGDVGIINTYENSENIFVKDNIRNTISGSLTQQDLKLITEEEYSKCLRNSKAFVFPKNWCIKLTSKEINDSVNSINLWGNSLNWAKKQNFPGKIYNWSRIKSEIDYTFNNFKKEGYFWWNRDKNYSYGIDNNPQNAKEITFQEMFPEYNSPLKLKNKKQILISTVKEINLNIKLKYKIKI